MLNRCAGIQIAGHACRIDLFACRKLCRCFAGAQAKSGQNEIWFHCRFFLFLFVATAAKGQMTDCIRVFCWRWVCFVFRISGLSDVRRCGCLLIASDGIRHLANLRSRRPSQQAGTLLALGRLDCSNRYVLPKPKGRHRHAVKAGSRAELRNTICLTVRPSPCWQGHAHWDDERDIE